MNREAQGHGDEKTRCNTNPLYPEQLASLLNEILFLAQAWADSHHPVFSAVGDLKHEGAKEEHEHTPGPAEVIPKGVTIEDTPSPREIPTPGSLLGNSVSDIKLLSQLLRYTPAAAFSQESPLVYYALERGLGPLFQDHVLWRTDQLECSVREIGRAHV